MGDGDDDRLAHLQAVTWAVGVRRAGAARYPGRWNRPGVPIVYGASSLSLAMLEVLVHVDPDEWPEDLVCIRFEMPEDVVGAAERVDGGALPTAWRAGPGHDALKAIGSDWAKAGRSAVLLVPSAVTPGENNLLLYPRHADIGKLVIHPAEPMVFDPRLRKGT